MYKRIISTCIAVIMIISSSFVVVHATSSLAASNDGTLYAYPEFDERIERDYMYSVSVTHKDGTTALPVYSHTEGWRGARNPNDETPEEYRRFSSFAFDNTDGAVTVNIKVNKSFTSYSVIPTAKGLASEFDATTGTIKVTLDKPEYFVVRLDGKDSTNIAILADSPETEVPEAGENTIIIDGWKEYEGGVLKLNKEGTTVYIKPGAVLNARIHITANNCKVIGRGAVLDPESDIYKYDSSILSISVVSIAEADNTTIDGIHILNAQDYNIDSKGKWGDTPAEGDYNVNTRVTNVKILSTQLSSDGIYCGDFNENFVAERCFIYCGDNAMVCEDGGHYSDITIGTNCNALYPQTDVNDSSFDNIYVFAAYEGIINQTMTGYYKADGWQQGDAIYTRINYTINNLHAEDIKYSQYFFYAENYGTRSITGDGVVMTNIYLPKLTSVIEDWFYWNDQEAEGLNVNITNLSINGSAVGSVSGNSLFGYTVDGKEVKYPDNTTFTLSKGSGFDPSINTLSQTVSYTTPMSVYLGVRECFFENAPIVEGETVYLPYYEIKKALGLGASENTKVMNGVKYIAHTALSEVGMAKSASLSSNKLTITPYNDGNNLLIPDEGILSRYSRNMGLNQDISVYKDGNDTVYRLTDVTDDLNYTGIDRILRDELQAYGAGTYTLSFKAKSNTQLAVPTLNIKLVYGSEYSTMTTVAEGTQVISNTGWTDCSLTITVNSAHLQQPGLVLSIYDDASGCSFDVKNITLTKSEADATAHTVTWKLTDKDITEKYLEGRVPYEDVDTLRNGYKFTGWDQEIAAVASDVTYTAMYEVFDDAQLYGAQVRGSDGAVRFIGTVENYRAEGLSELGFMVTVGDKTVALEITKVYTSIVSNGTLVYPENEGETFFTFCLGDVPLKTEFTVLAYAVIDGQQLVGEPVNYTFTGNDMILTDLGLNFRPDNSIEDEADFGSVLG